MTPTIENLIEAGGLKRGHHNNASEGLCAMEAVAWLMGKEHSDRPRCACPIISLYVTFLNDIWEHEQRQKLIPYLSRIAGSRSTIDVELRRAQVAADYSVEVFTPIAIHSAAMALEEAGFNAQADNLKSEAKNLRRLPAGINTIEAISITAESLEAAEAAAMLARNFTVAALVGFAIEAAYDAWKSFSDALVARESRNFESAAKASWSSVKATKSLDPSTSRALECLDAMLSQLPSAKAGNLQGGLL